MAEVIQPPFYVPRPAEQINWIGRPTGVPDVILLQLYFTTPQWEPPGDISTAYWRPTTQRNLVLFSAAPQVQPPQPARRFDYPTDQPIWIGQPLRAFTLGMPTTVTFFGAVGQAPTKRWNAHYAYNSEQPIWVGQPIDSAVIQNLTSTKFFGSGGQAPAKRWNAIYTIDTAPPIWIGKPMGSYMTQHPPAPPVTNTAINSDVAIAIGIRI